MQRGKFCRDEDANLWFFMPGFTGWLAWHNPVLAVDNLPSTVGFIFFKVHYVFLPVGGTVCDREARAGQSRGWLWASSVLHCSGHSSSGCLLSWLHLLPLHCCEILSRKILYGKTIQDNKNKKNEKMSHCFVFTSPFFIISFLVKAGWCGFSLTQGAFSSNNS